LSFRARVVLAAGWVAFVVYAYPGFMSFDSAVQLSEARAGHYTDWHPPVMAWLWRYLDMLVAGPLLMLLLQSGLLLFGTYALLRRVARSTYAACGAVAILVFPPVGTAMAVIWKDSLMVAAIVAGLALLVSPSRGRRIAALALFAFAAAVRYNGFTITLVPVIALFRWSDAIIGLRRYAIAAVAWLATVGCGQLANRALTDDVMHPWHGSLAMFDIVGTIRFSPPMSDDELGEILRGTPMMVARDLQREAIAAYDAQWGVFRIRRSFMQQPSTAEQRDAIERAWRTLVLAHPLAYAQHRWRVFRRVLTFEPRVIPYVWTGIDDEFGENVAFEPPCFQQWLIDRALVFASSWLMRVWMYGLLAIAMLGFARDRVALSLGVSAVISELALFVLAPTEDFRYSLWLVAAALLAVFWTFARRYELGQPSA
jgi:hypothetical protein